MQILTRHTSTPMMSPLVQLRIARRRVAIAWSESEYLQPLTVAALITLTLFGSIVAVLWAVW